MPKHAFLSDEWVAEARRIRAEYVGKLPPSPVALRMNQVIKKIPFPPGTLESHIDTTGGELDLETGHLDAPDLTVTVDWDVARMLLVTGDVQAAAQAFFGGRIKVDGNLGKLFELQATGATGAIDPTVVEMALRIQQMTE